MTEAFSAGFGELLTAFWVLIELFGWKRFLKTIFRREKPEFQVQCDCNQSSLPNPTQNVSFSSKVTDLFSVLIDTLCDLFLQSFQEKTFIKARKQDSANRNRK
jgi:hypothetical protein